MNIYSGDCEHGECGKETNLVDCAGAQLFVGDIVAIASKDKFGIMNFYALTCVVDDRPELVGRKEYASPFVMGLYSVDINTDESWLVKRIKSWQDCISGEKWKDFGFNYR